MVIPGLVATQPNSQVIRGSVDSPATRDFRVRAGTADIPDKMGLLGRMGRADIPVTAVRVVTQVSVDSLDTVDSVDSRDIAGSVVLVDTRVIPVVG